MVRKTFYKFVVRRVDVLKLCFANLATISNMYPFKAYLLQEKKTTLFVFFGTDQTHLKQATPIQIIILVLFFSNSSPIELKISREVAERSKLHRFGPKYQ